MPSESSFTVAQLVLIGMILTLLSLLGRLSCLHAKPVTPLRPV